MSFLPQTLYDGSPNPAAMYVNSLLIDGLYRQDRTPFQEYAGIAGATLAAFESNPITFTPDYGVLLTAEDALVVFAGTTNSAQWVAHIASAYFPLIDSDSGNSVVGSFYLGLNDIELAVTNAIRPEIRRNLILTGHSYGAGSLKIFADHIAASARPPGNISLMTFGEPKSTGALIFTPPTYQHLRIVGSVPQRRQPDDAIGLDPVTFSPPGVLQIFKFALTIALPLSFLGLKWRHFGSAWGLSENGMSVVTAYDNFLVKFDPTGWTFLVDNLENQDLHRIDSYLSNSYDLWRR